MIMLLVLNIWQVGMICEGLKWANMMSLAILASCSENLYCHSTHLLMYQAGFICLMLGSIQHAVWKTQHVG